MSDSTPPFDGDRLQDSSFARTVNLSGVRIENANLSDVDLRNANYAGMRIEGVLVTELLEAHGRR